MLLKYLLVVHMCVTSYMYIEAILIYKENKRNLLVTRALNLQSRMIKRNMKSAARHVLSFAVSLLRFIIINFVIDSSKERREHAKLARVQPKQ